MLTIKFLSCSRCERSASKIFLPASYLDNPEFKGYILRYLNDVSFNSGPENFENNKSYIHYFSEFFRENFKTKYFI